MALNSALTELCRLAYKYGTDKCPQLKHSYTPFYYELWKDKRNKIKKVLEIGIGHFKGMRQIEATYDPGLNRQLHRGASLYMWRDFFPHAQIYGADIRPETMFEDERITTFLCDERKKEDLVRLIENTGADIDIFVDDGSHNLSDQIFACQTLMPLLKKNVIYIVEDVVWTRKLIASLEGYNCWVPQIINRGGINQLVVVQNR